MALSWELFIFAIILCFNITELECTHDMHFNKTLYQASQMMTAFPLGISDAFDDASGVFGKVLGKVVLKRNF